jgi:hypothetical protein
MSTVVSCTILLQWGNAVFSLTTRNWKLRKCQLLFLGSQVLTAVIMTCSAIWWKPPCTLSKFSRRLRGTFHLHLQGRRMSQIRNQHNAVSKQSHFCILNCPEAQFNLSFWILANCSKIKVTVWIILVGDNELSVIIWLLYHVLGPWLDCVQVSCRILNFRIFKLIKWGRTGPFATLSMYVAIGISTQIIPYQYLTPFLS